MPERPVPGASPFTAEEQELFALLLAQAGLAGDGAEAVPGPPPAASPAARRPLSAAQQRLWFLHRLEPASPAYNMPVALRLRGELDRAALALALAAVVERHEVLRTLLPEDKEGRPLPVVVAGWPAAPLPADVDLAGLPAAAAAAAERLVLGTAARRPFDLGRGPLLRAVLLRQGPAEHVLCLVLHHIAGDGWSTGILLREIVAVYAAAIAGQPSPLAPLPLQYGDFAAWQRRRLQGSELARLLAYWRQRLPAVPPPLDLPGAVRTPSRQRGSRRTWIAGGELTAALHSLARGSGATLFAVLLTALAVLLRRLAGGARGELAGAGASDLDDLLVGAPVSGRDRLEWEGLVGCFLNTLALRCSWQGNPPVRELVRQTAGQVAEDFAHRELPFELLLEQLQPPRDLVQAPLLQVLLNMLTYPAARLQAPGLELTAVALPEEFAKLDLTLYVEPVGDDLKLDLVYDADRLDSAQMDHLLPQLAHLLRQMADAPEARVGDLSLVTAAAAALLPDPAAALRGEWRGGPLARLLAHAAKAPAQVAVADASGSFDYAELAGRSAALARQLRAAGVAHGEVVAVYGWRCGALAWALTGVLRAGAAFVILDPAHPAERLQAVLRQARPRGWVQLAQAGAPPVAVAELAAALAGDRRLELPSIGEHADARFLGRRPDTAGAETGDDDLDAAAADDLAYVAFTSGSSGQPKGVLGTHAPLAHFLAWYEGELALGPRDRFSLLSGLAHDPLLRDVFAPLWAGATLVAPDPDDLLVPGGLAAWLAEQAITVAHMTPSLARVLAAGATPGRSLPALRCLCFGGESVSWRDLARLRPLLPAAEWVGFYGATETPQAMGFWRPSRPAGGGDGDDGGDPPRGAGPPLGRGIEDVQLWVVTAGGRLAGIGERGEIHVRTPYLARGYLEDQPLTRERFLANWLTGSPADRVYRTGDLGRFLPDGQVEFLGRADRQLKVRGHRIEPAEVEAALHDVAGVRQALVTTCPGGPGAETETLLVAYVVLDPRRPPGAEELRARLRSRLPEAMVPTRFVPLDALPLTPAGKIDVRALPSPAAATAAAGGTRASRPPRTAAERALSTIWADVLGLTEVGAEDDFFTLGGDSIRMVQVLARARRHGLALSLAQFFAHPTVAALARAAGDAVAAAAAGPGAPAAAVAGAVGQGEDGEDVEAIYDLSPGQRGLLFPSSHERETGAYLTQTSWVLTGRLDRAAFAAAWGHVLLRHPVLRSSFRWRGLDRPVQAVHRQVPLPLLHVDWRRLGEAGPGAGGEARLRPLLDLDRRRGLDPSRAPLFRLLLIQETAERHQLIWTRHHLLLDGWSVGLVLRDVIETYRALSERRRPALPPARPFADFIAWLAVRDRAAAESFWRRALAGFADPTPLPLARHGGAAVGPGAATGQTVLQLAPALAESLRALAAARRLTLHSVLMGAWAVLLSRLADQADVVVGTTVAGRPVELPGVESIAGMLANVVPVRCLARTGERAAAFLAQVQETFVELLAHSWLALAEVQRCSAVPATRRLFDTLLAFESFPGLDAAGSLRELALARGISRERPGLPMNLAIEPPARSSADRLALRLLYDPSRCEALAMRRLLGYFANLLDSLAAAPDRRLDELELLGEAERHQLTLGWNESGPGPGPWLGPGGARTVVDLVLAEARRRPEAPAVVAAAERLTYGDLERLSARVARQLAAHGVGPEVPVALLAERSAGVIVALLAILRAGGAYLPLDPDEAPERIVALLADSAAPLLVAGERLLARRPELQAALASPPATPLRRVGLEALLAAAREAGGGDPAPAGRPLPDNLAYLTYTSGSTGQPKAVAVAHRGVARLVAGSSCFELGPREVTLHLAPLAFDASTFEIWGALARGGCVALPAPGPVSLAELGYAITRFGVTTLFLTTGLFHAMVDRRIGALAPLRQLLAGGEVLAPAQVRRVLAELPRTEFVACYGPTENTTFTSCHRLAGGEPLVTPTVPIGRPVAGTRTYALDRALRLVPVGATGELHTGGDGLARGYQGRPDWTAERFVPDPFGGAGERLYRTGDLVRQLPDGSFEFAGRRDGQVKVRGFRVEPGEIEATLRRHQAIRQAAVVARRDGGRATALVAFVAGETPGSLPPAPELRAWLRRRLPEAMVPGEVREVEALPLTPNGKVDRQALAALAALPAAGDAPAIAPPSGEAGSAGEVEELVAGIWREALGRERIGRHDNFFDLGGDSLKLMRVHDRLQSALDRELPIVELFEHPSLVDLAAHLSAGAPAPASAAFPAAAAPGALDLPAARSVAVLAAAGRFPGAQDVDELWRNLSAGIESISFFTAAQLAARGASPELLADPALVAARGVIADADCFDAAFFGFTPREAELMDPQHRVFLECAHAALEEAGCDPARHAGAIGVFAGSSSSSYLLHNLWPHPDLLRTAGDTLVRIGNDKDFLTSRVSYELGLRGPSVSVQTACSTSLVAVHLACQALLAGECDMALAGGVTVKVPQSAGHLYHSGGIGSPDGHCRAFAAEARGTVGGDGVGVVVLKRLDAALADGDPILGVILGSAVNNDGAAKPGYTAPGPAGQEAAIRAALAAAGVGPETVTYVEAHGTGTPLGDPVEIAALNRAFAAGGGAGPGRAGACAIGSVKTNLGHLDAAAGIAGLIKVLLALRQRQIPPSLHFTAPNPAIDFAGGPFRVSTELADWRPPAAGGRLRAGVSSFGIGGTNAHVVVEEPPPLAAASPGRRWQLLPLSARSAPALAAAAERLGRHLACHPEQSLPDVAFTLQLGRGHFEHRRALVCSDPEAAARLLQADHRRRLHASSPAGEPVEPAVAFLFAGQAGGRRLELGRDLHAEDPVFRAELDRCAELLLPHLGLDLRQVLMPPPAEEAAAAALLGRTAIAQPALFAVEYALARTFMAWGIMPRAMLGHSLGEYVAACLAGVFSLADALSLIACRGRLMERMTGGAMLALPLTEAEVGPLLSPGLSLAAVNAAARVVVSGEAGEIERLAARLDQRGISHRRLATAHAFHSAMMEPILAGFAAELERIARHPPRIPFVSNLSGTWIRPGEAVDPAYWVRHLRGTVRFADGIGELWREPRRCLLELGPGDELAAFARRHPARREDQPVIAALGGRHGGAGAAAETERGAAAATLTALGDLWLAGAEVRWEALHSGTRRRRVRLPSYPFARQRHWVEPRAARALPPPGERAALDDWFYTLGWRRAPAPGEAPGEPAGGPGHGPALGPALAADACCLVLVDRRGVGERLAQRLAGEGRTVIRAETGAAFRRLDPRRYALAPLRREDFDALLAELRAAGQVPSAVVHLWSLDAAAATPPAPGAAGVAALADGVELAFHSLLLLAQSLAASAAAGAGGEAGAPPVRLLVATAGAQAVPAGGGEVDEPHPEQAPALGLARVIAREIPGLACSAVDLPPRVEDAAWAAAALCAELARDGKEPGVAYRDGERWQERIEPVRLAAVPATARRRLRERGVYLITGGLGGVGHVLAGALAQAVSARLVLVGRTPLASGADSADRERKRRRLRELQELGAEVLALQADVADRQQMAAALGQARERFGAIHGVIHAAGVAGGGIIQTRTAAAAGSVLAPKIRGALVLADLLAGSDLDFLVLCSSLESALGSIGQGDYCAANRFLDAFARRRVGSFTAAIGWDTWRETGMAVDTPVPAALRPARERSLALGMDDAEAVEVFWRVLGGDLPQVWVSTRDLHRRLAAASGGVAAAPTAAATTPSRPAVWSGPSHHLERRIAGIWSEVLGIPDVAADVSFFDLGGDSLLALGLAARLSRELGFEVPALMLFEAPTVSALAARLATGGARGDRREGAGRQAEPAAASGAGIAIIGMAGRLPGARDLEELWRNLHDGVESITAFSSEELAAAGVPGPLLADPRYVRARPRLAACEWFDAGFFGFSPREAEITDPQHRVFLECAWEALESSGYDPAAYAGRIAVVAGSGAGAYLANLVSRPDLLAMTDPVQVSIGNDKDALSTSVSYRLDLRGPSLTVQTFCSTGLVAVHTARRLLLDGECDIALAGAVSIGAVEPRGYLCQEGGILSPDGHVRAFDARAQGTVFGDGAGVVVLKRLADAQRDGDTVRAVIRGSAVNNDGAQKIGFAAPNVEGQAAVIAAALASAGLGPEAISYVEAHGTGTALGDPIEVSALHRVFATPGRSPGSCALGSVKTNVGHLDRAAGLASLFKAVLALEHATIPPTLHFSRPNPRLDLAAGPFFVNTAPLPWVSKEAPRRAGVTSLGFGGTNAHLVLEEAPPVAAGEPRRDRQLIVLSAKSATALERLAVALAGHLRAHPELDLADVAYTCQVCRSRFSHRRFVIAGDPAEAAAALEEMPPPVVVAASRRELLFLLPAAGDEELGAIADLAGPLRAEPVLREELAACREALRQQLDAELLAAADALWAGAGGGSPGGVRPAVAEPALCAVEIALGRHWLAWGLAPAALLGAGVGELAADCLAGRLTREEALAAAATRGRRLEEAAAGAEPPAASGEGQGGPGLLAELFRDPDRVLFDVGPGGTLGTLARDHPNRPAAQAVVLGGGGVATARLPRAPLLEALGHLWLLGERPDWDAFHAPARRRRVPLPTYPFERQRYWIAAAPDPLARRDDLADWFYLPRWVPAPPAGAAAEQPPAAGSWLLFADALGLGERIAARLAAAGHGVMLVRPGDRCGRAAGAVFVIDPRRRGDYDALLAELAATSGPPRRILHLWGLGGGPVAAPAAPLEPLAAGFYSLLLLAQALSSAAGPDALRGVHLGVVSDRAVAVTASEEPEPRKAAALGPCQVLPKEHPGLRCVAIDVVLPPPGSRAESELIDRLIAEVADPAAPARVAWRGRQRLELAFAPLRLAAPAIRPAALRHRGVVLITGGLGGIGLALAEGLAREASARLVLVGRTPLPPRRQWESWLAEQGEADPVSRKLRAILALERLGAEVLPLTADAADAAAMATVVDTVRRRLGGLHGVIHAAGVPGGGLLRWRSPEAAARVLAPKVAGTAALLAALAGLDLDFFVACSSLESVLGSYGQADYYAANAALEAFTHAAARSGCPAVAIAWDAWQEVGMAATAASRPRQAVAVHPLLRGPLLQTAERTVYAVDLAGPGRWVVDDHRLADGRLLLPGAAHAELARAIAARHFGAAAIEVADLVFAAPLVLRPDEPREVFAVAGPGPGPGPQLELAVVSRGGEPGAWQEHARCTLRPASGSAPPRVALDEVLARCPEPRQRSPAGRLLRFGPRWSEVVVHAWLGTAEGLASFELPPALAGDLAEIGLHPALLDLATGWAGSLAGGSFLPLSYRRLRVWAPLPARIWSFARLAGDAAPGRETLAFDLTLLAPDGEVLAEIDDFTVKRVREGAMLAGPATQLPGRTAAAGPPALYADLITAAERAAAALAHGIRPAEGYEVLRRVLARPLPPLVIVSTRDLQALLRREPPAFGPAAPRPETAAAALAAAPAAAHPRPALSTPYAPSGDGVEGSLAEIWQRVLGIERIGVNDNFFELGGDSIAGLQVVAAAGRAGLELAPRLLFEHPTIAGLAGAVERESAAAAGHGPAPVAALPAAPAVPPAAVFPAAALAPGDWERLAAQIEVREPPRPDQPAEVDHAAGQRR